MPRNISGWPQFKPEKDQLFSLHYFLIAQSERIQSFSEPVVFALSSTLLHFYFFRILISMYNTHLRETYFDMFLAKQSLRQISPIPGKWLILCRGTDRHNYIVKAITLLNSTPPLSENEHIRGSNPKWAYNVLTFMPNYELKTKRWQKIAV